MRHLAALIFLTTVLTAGLSAQQTLPNGLGDFLSGRQKPTTIGEFSPLFHLTSKNQDTTLVCWSFSTTSFLETEMKRLGLEPVQLARMWPVYHVFLEKAKRYVATKGASRFAPGDLFTGVMNVIKEYGIVPESAYRGQTRVCETYNHEELYAQLSALMRKVKAENRWNEEEVLADVKTILDKHLGVPPAEVTYNGKTYTPKSFLRDVVKLPWNDYLLVTSFTYAPFKTFVRLNVPDNWSKDSTYFNVPLDLFYSALKQAVTGGYSAAIDADITEPSYELTKQYAFIPDVDTPAELISQGSREFRFSTGATTDDHLLHVIGFKSFGNEDWFLVKDSWRTAFQGNLSGYFFFHESYVKLKVLAYLVHRDGVPSIKATLPRP